jgi:polysaccharide biosynthesis/export protein
MHFLITTILLICFLLAPRIGAQETAAAGLGAPEAANARADLPNLQQRYPRYKLRAGDIMALTLRFSPEFNQTVTVQPDGFVSLQEAGDVYISGKTVPEATEAIKASYSKFLHDPEVSIVLTEFDKPSFIVNGTVRNPGKYELRGDTTVSEGLAMAGGLTEASKHSQVWLYRRRPDDTLQATKLDLKRMWAKQDLKEDIFLQPGDMIFVPQNTFSKIKGVIIPKPMAGVTARP